MSAAQTAEVPPTSVTNFVLKLTEATLPLDQVALTAEDRQAVVGEVASFVQVQLGRLPRHLAILFSIGTSAFRFYARARTFSSFCALPLEGRVTVLNSWAYGNIALFRNLFRVVRSLAFLSFFEIPAVVAALEKESDAGAPEEGQRSSGEEGARGAA